MLDFKNQETLKLMCTMFLRLFYFLHYLEKVSSERKYI